MAYATRAPGTLPEIDWSNPLTRGLVSAYVPGAGGQGKNIVNLAAARDYLTGKSASVIAQSASGQGLASSAGNMGATCTASDALKVQSATGFVLFDKTGSPNAGNYPRPFAVAYDNVDGAPVMCYGFQWEGANLFLIGNYGPQTNVASVAWAPTALRPNAVAFSYTASAPCYIYIDGAQAASGTPPAGAITYSSTSQVLLNIHQVVSGDYTGMSALVAAIWNRPLTAGEHRALARNPWQIFKAPPSVASRALLGGSSAAGAVAFSGTAATTFGQTGALTAALKFTGTATATFGQTGALTTTPQIAATVGATFGQSAAFTTVPRISATATIQFGQSGTFTVPGTVPFAGTATTTFGQTAVFTVPITFTGSAATVFGQSAAFTIPSPSSAISWGVIIG
jgi:hypothetical protein